MGATSQSAPLTNLQLELLKLFTQNVDEEDLIAIRRMIARYFAEKAMGLADQAWEEKGWTDEDATRLAHTKMRTPYKPSQK